MAKQDDKWNCYARAIGGCSEKPSDEHYFSKGVLKCIGGQAKETQTIYGKNLAFQKPGMRKKLLIGRLKADILCTTHNNALKPFDDAGKAFCEAAENLHRAATVGKASADMPRVNGNALERWMLRTLCGALYSGKVWRELVALKNIEPPFEWLEILYNLAGIQSGQGIYWQPYEIGGFSVSTGMRSSSIRCSRRTIR
jgi:hypothetical protein